MDFKNTPGSLGFVVKITDRKSLHVEGIDFTETPKLLLEGKLYDKDEKTMTKCKVKTSLQPEKLIIRVGMGESITTKEL